MEKEKIIKLNIGGVKYEVSRDTLNMYPDTMLARLISGNIPTQKVKGRIFIDRDGILFNYILDYLRNKQNWIIPTDMYLLITFS